MAHSYLDNPFSIDLLSSFSQSLKNAGKRAGYTASGNNYHLLNKVEQYQSEAFRIQSSLSKTADTLSHIRIFMGRYPFKKYYLQHGISQLEYIQYHSEALFNKIHAIREIMRLLINHIYQLRLPERNCSYSNLIHKIGRDCAPLQIYDLHTRTFEKLIDLRHVHAHGGQWTDKERDEINTYDGLAFYKFEAQGFPMSDELKALLPLRYVEFKITEYRKKRLELLDQAIAENGKLLQKFLSTLHSEYERQVKLKRQP